MSNATTLWQQNNSGTVKSSLGPKGMDKMLVDSSGDVTLPVMDDYPCKIDIDHPAAKMMVEVAKTQDAEVGDEPPRRS